MMPTYDYQCADCARTESIVQSISEYTRMPKRPRCCAKEMERKLSINPAFSGLANALAGDRHYDGLRASDGADISSRAKHREYMKANGLADPGDFSSTWQKQQAQREMLRAGAPDASLKRDVAEVVERAIQN